MTDLYGRLSRTLIECEACLITVLNRKQEIVWFNESIPLDDDHIAEVIIEIPEKEHSL